jgi:hypothetical protein
MNFPLIKENLARVGRLVSPKAIHYGNGILNYLNLGRWFHERGLSIPVRCDTRPLLYDAVRAMVHEPVTYLEFGVYKGDSLHHWTTLLKDAKSTLHGFDSFEGLPEDWGPVDREYLNVRGIMPRFDDPRVKLFKGWFSETLPSYVAGFKPHPTLIIYLDADLYSSTIFVLQQLRSFIIPGTILIFDEFWDREHEMRAFTEFINEEKLAVKCLAATRTLSQVAFQITGKGAVKSAA